MGLVSLIGFDQWVFHLSINQDRRKSLRACGRVCVLDVLFLYGPPVEVRDFDRLIIAFAEKLSFSVGTDKQHLNYVFSLRT